MRVLLVEDEARLAAQVKSHLCREGMAVDVAADGPAGLELARHTTYDVILLDLGLPRLDGMAVCRALRHGAEQVPILMLTARDALAARVAGLDAGADDYLVKPFALEELAARVRALLRRPREGHPVVLRVADLALDTASRTAERAGRRIWLTAREFAMLELLMNIIDVYVNRLRTKIDRDFSPKLIHTLRGQGYVCRGGEPPA